MNSNNTDSSNNDSSSDDLFYGELNSDISNSDDEIEDNQIMIKSKQNTKLNIKPKIRVCVSRSRNKKNSDIQSIIDSTAKMNISSKSSTSDKLSENILTNKRKIIYYENDPIKPVTAAGVIFYRYDGKDMQLMLINSRNKLEDIGGKIDQIDRSIEEAAAREVEEETNKIIKANDIIDRLNEALSNQKIYVKNSKYLIYIIKANELERELTTDDFGDYENHDKIKRTIQWISRDTAFSTTFIRGGKLNHRIRSIVLKNALVNMDKHKKFNKSMFH